MADTGMPQTNAPAAPAASAPSPQNVPSTGDIFDELERNLGLDDESQEQQNLSDASKYREGDTEDLLNTGNEEDETDTTSEETPTEGESEEGTEPAAKETEDAFPDLAFNGKVGEKNYNFKIKNKEHLDKIVKRAIVAEDLYRKVNDYSKMEKDYTGLKEYHEQLERTLEESPQDVLNMIVEDMDEEVLKQWVLHTAENLARPAEQRALEKRLKHAEMLEQRMQEIEEEKRRVSEMRKQTAAEQDKRAIQTWQQTWEQKLSARVPEGYLDLAKATLYDARREAKERQDRGENISLKTLDAIATRKLKPIVDLIKRTSNVADKVKTEVGKTLDAKKQQNLTKIQGAVSSQTGGSTPKKSRMQRYAEESNVFGMFDEILDGVDSGRIRIREG